MVANYSMTGKGVLASIQYFNEEMLPSSLPPTA